jgi:glycolate oxidase
MPTFAKVTDALAGRLEAVVGAAHVVTGGPDLEPYAHDETEDLRYPPEIAVRPKTAEEVAAVLAIAWEADVPVTPRGGGTGLSGGALPLFGGIALALDRMDAILEIDEANLACVVQPGVITKVIHDAVAERGLYYPPDPASYASCTIGGNIAENAGGPHCVKYGLTRDYVLALQAATPDGRLFRTGGKLRKDVAGYDLAQLLVGSEGTLAVVTEATLKLVPLPAHRRLLVAPFADLDAAARGMLAVVKARILPAALEVLGRSALEAAAAHLGRPVPFAASEAAILLETDGNDARALDEEIERIGAILLAADALDVVLADSPAKERELWAVRRCLGEAVKKKGLHVECDAAVPPASVPALFAVATEVAAAHGVEEISYGHAGDGNVHVNLIATGFDREEGMARLHAAADEVFRRAVALGGTITGEHGVGCAKRAWLPLCRDAVALELMRAVKHALDPKGLLNPGKVL